MSRKCPSCNGCTRVIRVDVEDCGVLVRVCKFCKKVYHFNCDVEFISSVQFDNLVIEQAFARHDKLYGSTIF